MSDQDVNVNSALLVSEQTIKPEEQVVQVMLHDQTSGNLVHHLVDPSSLTPQSAADAKLAASSLNKIKRPVPVGASCHRELSKQWKILCKKAKEWCGLHGSQVPSFVMMYLDDNKLVWEGPDHMESFISDENVISAFLRTAVSPGAGNKTSSVTMSFDQDSFMDQTHPSVSEAESTVVEALEQLGQMQPNQGSDAHSSQYATMEAGGSSGRATATGAGDCEQTTIVVGEQTEVKTRYDQEDDDEDDDDVRAAEEKLGEDGSDVLSEVIDSVIKEWEPGQDTKRAGLNKRRARAARGARQGGIVVDTTVGTFEIVRNNKRKVVVGSPPSSDRVRVISVSKQGSGTGTGSGIYRELVPCSECGKCISRNNLNAHQRIHRGEFRFRCEVCDKGFYNKKDLLVHFRIHTGERPFNCSICLKSFRQKSKVKEHMLTHSGEKPHRCEHCQHAFARRSDLKCHIRLHTGEKPYQCNDCGKSFTQPGNYRAHLRTHTKEARGQVIGPCDSCGRSYSSLSSWKDHLLTHHSSTEQVSGDIGGGELVLPSSSSDLEPGTIMLEADTDEGMIVTEEHHQEHHGHHAQQHQHQQHQQQILVDLGGDGQQGTVTLNMTEDGQVLQQGGEEIRTILINADSKQNVSGLFSDQQFVVLTNDQAARLVSMSNQ